jgi:autotransporter-associated beta strand protein
MKMKTRNLSAIASLVAFIFMAGVTHAQSSTWLGNSGNWSDTTTPGGVWSGGVPADGTNNTANFTGVDITSVKTITLDSNRTIGNITFTDTTTSSHDVTIDGSSTLTLDVASGSPTINVTQSGRTLAITCPIAGSEGLTKSGSGILALSGNNTFTGVIAVSAGKLIINGGQISNAAVVNVNSGNCTMIITNGATLVSGGSMSQIGNNNNNNLVLVVGGGVTPSVWNLGNADLNLGGNSYNASPSNNVLMVDGAGVYGSAIVTNVDKAFSTVDGFNGSACYSSIVVTNGGQFFINGQTAIGNNYYGPKGHHDSIVVVGGAADSMYYGSSNSVIVGDGIRPDSHDNLIYVGAGGVMTNVGYYASDRYQDFVMGYGHNGSSGNPLYRNQLVVTGGGKVFMLGNLTVGYSTSGTAFSVLSNSVLIANGGLVNAPGALNIGVNASTVAPVNFNSLTITNGGQLFTGANSTVGRATASSTTANSNTVWITGGNSLWNLSGKTLTVGSKTGTGLASGNVLKVSDGGVATNISALMVSATNTLELMAGGLVAAGAVTNSGTLAVTLDGSQTPSCGRLAVTGNLNLNNATLAVTLGTKTTDPCVIATYGTLTGAFAVTNGLSDKYRLDMNYKGENKIAIVYTVAGTIIHLR